MFREIKNTKKQIAHEEALALLKDGEHGVLSTMGEDGYPYGIPLNHVFHDGKIIFHCADQGHKLENIAFNPKVSFCVVAQADIVPEKYTTRFKSVIAFGTARLLEGDEKTAGLMALVKRFAPDNLANVEAYIKKRVNKTTVVAMDVAHLSGKMAPGPKKG